jgi:hypothetical protein
MLNPHQEIRILCHLGLIVPGSTCFGRSPTLAVLVILARLVEFIPVVQILVSQVLRSRFS